MLTVENKMEPTFLHFPHSSVLHMDYMLLCLQNVQITHNLCLEDVCSVIFSIFMHAVYKTTEKQNKML